MVIPHLIAAPVGPTEMPPRQMKWPSCTDNVLHSVHHHCDQPLPNVTYFKGLLGYQKFKPPMYILLSKALFLIQSHQDAQNYFPPESYVTTGSLYHKLSY